MSDRWHRSLVLALTILGLACAPAKPSTSAPAPPAPPTLPAATVPVASLSVAPSPSPPPPSPSTPAGIDRSEIVIAERVNRDPVALALVIDRSGSMTGLPIDMARKACVGAVEGLARGDWLTVIAFDSQPRLVVAPQLITDAKPIAAGIALIQAGGGTDIFPALEEAYLQIRGSTARAKQVVLLTDGMAPVSGIREVVEAMRRDNITVSTVGLGANVDDKLLKMISGVGLGRHHHVEDPRKLVGVFEQEVETLIASLGSGGDP